MRERGEMRPTLETGGGVREGDSMRLLSELLKGELGVFSRAVETRGLISRAAGCLAWWVVIMSLI